MTIITNAMIVTVDGVQWGVQKYPYRLTFRRITGPNQKVAINGDTIYDIVANKKDLTVKLIPMPASDLVTLSQSYNNAIVSVSFFNPLENATETMQALVTFGEISLGIKSTSKEVFEGIDVTFTEV